MIKRLMINDLRLKILAVLALLFIIQYSLIINPIFAQAPPPAGAAASIDASGLGQIAAPSPLLPFIKEGKSGAGGISLFLTNGVFLFYMVASIVFIFMLLWGAWDWITSGGDKEKVAAARNRIIHAIIGLVLFSIAFAVMDVIGTFTGFTFVTPTNPPPPPPTI